MCVGLGGLSMCIIKLLELNIEHVCGLGGLSMCIIKLFELNIEHVVGWVGYQCVSLNCWN